ncbi:5'-3' exonuclease [Patescibacteria group bacterium]|nr:5'-3' exonuclease [Patescibacteria group bacterium]
MPTNSKEKRTLIMDGSHYLYRAYYGVPDSAKLPSGLQVNAVYGFFAYLRKVVDLVKPSDIIVVFDSETGVSEKVIQNASYKANRDYSDTGMYEQLPIIKAILTFLTIPYIEPHNFEADDYIGALANQSKIKGDTLIFSNDADFLQLLDGSLNVVKIGRKQPELIDNNIFSENFGFDSKYYIDYLTLKGDTSDNIPGVPGIGKKTAQKLISSYGSIENVYANLSDLPERLSALLLAHGDIVEDTYNLLKINTSIEIEDDEKLSESSFEKYDELNGKTNYLLTCVGINTK